MEVEGKTAGGGGKIHGMRLQWEGHIDGERLWKWKGRRQAVEGRYLG